MAEQNYTPEEHAAAWTEYYRQQGYDDAQIAAALGQTSSSSSGYTGGSSSTANNGFPSVSYVGAGASGTSAPNSYPAAGSSSKHIPAAATRQVFDTDFMQQSSAYLPGAAQELAKANPKAKQTGKRETVIRKGNGLTWEDPTLLDWDPKWFRLFVGDVSNDVNERTLDEAFSKYPSYCKCKVVRDRLSLKAKYGFIAFKDPEDFLKAWKENDGKYIGNRPIRLSKVKDDKYGSIATVAVSGRKAKTLDKLRRNHGKPLDGRPTPW